MSKFFTSFNLPEGHALVDALPDSLSEYVHVKVRNGKRTVTKLHDAGSFGPTRTSQAEAKDADINVIVSRFTKSNTLPAPVSEAMYGDFSAMPDLKQSLDIVRDASEKFSLLSAKVRDRFNNDPVKFVDFCADPSNYDEAVKLGLASKREVPKAPEPMLVKVVPDTPKA